MPSIRTSRRLCFAGAIFVLPSGCGARTATDPATEVADSDSGPETSSTSTSATSGDDDSTMPGPPPLDVPPLQCISGSHSCDNITCEPNDNVNCGECGRVCPFRAGFGGCDGNGLDKCGRSWSECVVPDGVTTCADICAVEDSTAISFPDPDDPATCTMAVYFDGYSELDECVGWFMSADLSPWTEILCTDPIPYTVTTDDFWEYDPGSVQTVIGAVCFCDPEDPPG